MRLPCLLFSVAACVCFAQAQNPAPAEQNQATPAKPVPETQPPAEEGAAAPVDPKTYKIGAEDVLRIHVWREAELSAMVIVRPDGRITLPAFE